MNKINFSIRLTPLIVLLLPTVTYGQFDFFGDGVGFSMGESVDSGGVTRLTNIPFVAQNASIGELVFGLFLLAISLAAVFAVVKLVIAGIKYTVTDIASTKESAKSDIKGAILGLLLILSTILIVNLINPGIANTDIALEQVNLTMPQNQSPTRNSVDILCSQEGIDCETVGCGDRRELDVSCALWCENVMNGFFHTTAGGYLTENQCIVPNSTDNINESIADALCESVGLEPDSCEIRHCGQRGFYFSCKNWCENTLNGIYIESDGGFLTTNRCAVPNADD